MAAGGAVGAVVAVGWGACVGGVVAVGSGVDVGLAVGSGVALGSGVDVGVAVGSGVGVGSRVGVSVGDGSGVGDGVFAGGGASNAKVALARSWIGGPMLGQDVSAITVTSMRWPAPPRTAKLPLRLPSRLMVAEPATPSPLTVASPAGAAPNSHSHPLPPRSPLTDGASPEEGLSTRAGASAPASGARPALRMTRAETAVPIRRALRTPAPPCYGSLASSLGASVRAATCGSSTSEVLTDIDNAYLSCST